MKRLFIILVCSSLVFIFIVYSGFFRDNSNPISVVDFYYQCMRNWEWFLAVPIYAKQSFSFVKTESDYMTKRLFEVKDVKLNLLGKNTNKAVVSVILTFKDGHSLNGIVDLVNEQSRWLITAVSYK